MDWRKILRMVRFQAKVLRPAEGGDWTFLRVPQEASDQMPTRSMLSVEGTVNGYAFQTYLHPDGQGGHWLKLLPDIGLAARISAGDVVALEISPSKVEPEPEVPEDLRAALDASPAAMSVWSSTTPLARRDWISWMTSGKKAETRNLRREKMMDMLAHGKRRVCCFDRSGVVSGGFSCPDAASEE